MSRPIVNVYSGLNGKRVGNVPRPGVFSSPIRTDVVHHVHRDIAKNRRHPYGVSPKAGHQTSAESWGTGRAVARIPRVPGGGTHRAGQGAFGNMCRGGRMYAPTKTYRRWHRKVNKNQRRFATVSALAASSVPALVLARGHKIQGVAEIPLVVSNETISNVAKTSSAKKVLKELDLWADVEKVKSSRTLRAGKGKFRNRRYRQRRGPLIVYKEKAPMNHAFRNLPGVEFCSVKCLNLLKLAPGGHMGRLILWTKDAFEQLNSIYGSYRVPSTQKFGFKLPRSIMYNSDLSRLITSSEIQSVLKRKKRSKKYVPHKKNPLKNLGVMLKLNPYAKTLRRKELLRSSYRAKKIAKRFIQGKKDRKELIRIRTARRVARKAGTAEKDLPALPVKKVKRVKSKTIKPRKPGQKPKLNPKKCPWKKMNQKKKQFVKALLK